MSNPAITVGSIEKKSFQDVNVYYLNENKKFSGNRKNISGELFLRPENNIQRYSKIAEWSMNIIKKCDCVFIEGYSMGSKGSVFNIAENTGILKYEMYKNKIKWTEVPPTVVKKFATGKGNGDKNKMYESFLSRANVDLKNLFNFKGEKIASPISDIVDSYYIFLYGVQSIKG